jgi:ribosomal protein S18 acetylase RimI-like enzyme
MPASYLQGLSVAEKSITWRDNLQKHGLDGWKRVVLACRGQEILGFVRVGVEPTSTDSGLVYLLYLHPSFWHNGIGRKLAEAGEEELLSLGAKEATLWVLTENHRARSFYQRFGWKETGERSRERYGDVELEALCYRKRLGSSA